MMGFLGVCIALIFCFTASDAAIPSYIKVCHKNEPNVDACIQKSIELLREKLIGGIPELNVPSLEPLAINQPLQLTIGGAGSRPTNITSIQVWGASKFNLLEFRSKISKNYYRFKFQIPKLHLNGTYQVDAKILFLQLQGDGPLKIDVENYQSECVLQGHKIKQGSSDYVKYDKLTCTAEIGDAKIALENLFNNNKNLEKATNDALNDNINDLFLDIRPGLLDAVTQRFLEVANRIAGSFTYQELFP